MKKILFLGGSYAQIPAIRMAREIGLYVITCDYLPENPGHKFADEYYNVSTTDKEAVFSLAKNLEVDYVLAYASDPAAPVAAYVSENLGLPGNPYNSILVLSEKNRFRDLLRKNKFNCPQAVTLNENELIDDQLDILEYPFIIKPVDSSGSRGVRQIDSPEQLEEAIAYALSFSRKKQVIAEEFIDNEIADIHGDGFVLDGKLVFSCLGDHIYNSKSYLFNPSGTLWPSRQPNTVIEKITRDVAEIISLSGFKNGPINIEARVNSNGIPFIMEIGARSGGHFVPQAINYATGFDMVDATLKNFMGLDSVVPKGIMVKPTAYYAIHSDEEGILEALTLKEELKPYLLEFHQYKHPGNRIDKFEGANAALGILLLQFNNQEEMQYIISCIHSFIDLRILITEEELVWQ